MPVDTAAVSMNIKSQEAHDLARRLAEREGTSLTDAVTIALREAIERREADDAALLAEVKEIAARIRAKLPPGLTSEQALADLYDEDGLPR
jgi:antitoxin VapB